MADTDRARISTSFVVAVASETSLRFEDGPLPMQISSLPSDVGPVDFIFRTRYSEEGFEAPVPRELWIDARGEASCSVREAAIAYATTANSLMSLLCVSGNGAVGDAVPKIAFDNTPGRRRRDFLQIFVGEERGIPLPGRRLDVPGTIELFNALDGNEHQERILRAMEQYRLALSHWLPGRETLSLMHLYMGMEALTKAALRHECSTVSMTEDELCAAWAIERKELDSRVRQRILFRDDTTIFTKARKASDGLEHGFLPFPEISSLATEARDRTATYLREAILRLAGIGAEAYSRLVGTPFDVPHNPWHVKRIAGTLTAGDDDLAAPEHEYPLAIWQTQLKSFVPVEGGLYSAEVGEELTLSLAAGVVFQPEEFEVRGSDSMPGHTSHE